METTFIQEPCLLWSLLIVEALPTQGYSPVLETFYSGSPSSKETQPTLALLPTRVLLCGICPHRGPTYIGVTPIKPIVAVQPPNNSGSPPNLLLSP